MTEKNYVEQWVCLATLSEVQKQCERLQRGECIDVELFRQLATSITSSIPIATSPPTFDALPSMSGLELIRVEVRHDNREPYLAGLVRSRPIAISFMVRAIDYTTGASLPARVDECYMFNEPAKPTTPQAIALEVNNERR